MHDLTDKTFGRLTVKFVLPPRAGKKRLWMCSCSCGGVAQVETNRLRSGHTSSCGCLRAEAMAKTSTRHGFARVGKKVPEFSIWAAMRQRCSNPKFVGFADYGGRGISVCDRWADFQAFYADMGPRPSKGHSIDRMDNNKGYEPSNCRWATRTEQNSNRRDNVLVCWDDHVMTISAAARFFGLDGRRVLARINRDGWSVSAALTTPLKRAHSAASETSL